MSLETLIQNLTAALEANTAAILGAGGQTAAATGSTEKTTKTTKATAEKTTKTTKPKYTVDQASSLLLELKDGHGIAHAKEILAAHGVAKMAEMPEEKAEAIYLAAKAKLEELAAGAASSSDAEDDGI